MNKYLLAALLAAIFALACGQGSTDVSSTTPVEVVNTDPEIELATLAIEIKGQPANALQPRRLGPPTETPLVTLTNENDGQVVNVTWTGALAYAKVKMGTYVCEVVAEGFAPDTSSITVNESDLGSTVNVTISLRANGPTKPEPVQLGTYKQSIFDYDTETKTVGLLQDDKQTADWVYTPGEEGELGTYATVGSGGWICRELDGDKLNCDNSTEWATATVSGAITLDKHVIELTEVWSDVDGNHGAAFHRYTRK